MDVNHARMNALLAATNIFLSANIAKMDSTCFRIGRWIKMFILTNIPFVFQTAHGLTLHM
jgi:hypothetical protein